MYSFQKNRVNKKVSNPAFFLITAKDLELQWLLKFLVGTGVAIPDLVCQNRIRKRGCFLWIACGKCGSIVEKHGHQSLVEDTSEA